MAQNKDLVADAQTLLEENLSEKKSVESARRLSNGLPSGTCFSFTCPECKRKLKSRCFIFSIQIFAEFTVNFGTVNNSAVVCLSLIIINHD